MIQKQNRISSTLFASAVAVAFLVPQGAQANSQGQFDYSGRAASCLNCHGPDSYDGLDVTLSGTSDVSCWTSDNPTADSAVWTNTPLKQVGYGESASVVVSIATPAGGEGPTCPTSDCCAPNANEGQCAQDEIDVNGEIRIGPACLPFFNMCPTTYAGINAETNGGGEFKIADADDSLKYAPNDNRAQLSHTNSHDFTLDGDASWSFDLVAPTEENATGEMNVWVGANVANGNGYADKKDLNSNYLVTVTVGDELPSYCRVCDEEGTLPDDTGECSGGCGCSAEQTSDDSVALGAFAFAFGAFMVRRRRRRGARS